VDIIHALMFPSQFLHMAGPSRAASSVCRACFITWGCESPTQPDGGEVLAKRKGVTVRWGLKAAWSKAATRRTGIR